jgi:hypothetical protein
VVGGSIASSIYGKPRATQDVDVIADLQDGHVRGFVAALDGDFYLDEPAIRDAVRRRSTFNVIHLETMFKVDVFVARDDPATVQELERGHEYVPPQAPEMRVALASPEDTVVQKLHWSDWATTSPSGSGRTRWASWSSAASRWTVHTCAGWRSRWGSGTCCSERWERLACRASELAATTAESSVRR